MSGLLTRHLIPREVEAAHALYQRGGRQWTRQLMSCPDLLFFNPINKHCGGNDIGANFTSVYDWDVIDVDGECLDYLLGILFHAR